MAYSTSGLRRLSDGVVSQWLYDTPDAVTSVVGAGYFTDGTSSSTAGTPGRGMNIGDIVIIRVVGAVPTGGNPPASNSDQAYAFVTTANTTTGAVTIALAHSNA